LLPIVDVEGTGAVVKDAVPLDCELYHTSVWAFKALAVSATAVRPYFLNYR
jgi:hypothetical protein